MYRKISLYGNSYPCLWFLAFNVVHAIHNFSMIQCHAFNTSVLYMYVTAMEDKTNIYCAYCVPLSLIAGCKVVLHKVIPIAWQFHNSSLNVSIAVSMMDGAFKNMQRRHYINKHALNISHDHAHKVWEVVICSSRIHSVIVPLYVTVKA